MSDPVTTIRNKLLLRFIAPLTALTFLNSLDRVNVSFAALQMNAELGLTPERYGFGVGLFFVGYLAFQFPHTALLRRFGPRRWIFVTVLCWGVIATALGFIQNAAHFYALRVLLGFAEAGFAPGIVYIMSQWLPRRFRALGIAGTMLAIPISIVFGGPLSGWLMTVDAHGQLPGWRFMFLIEGGATLLVAFATPWFFADTPAAARFLTADEKLWLERELERDRASSVVHQADVASFREVVRSGRVWAAAGVWFSLMSGAYGIIYWLPQVIKQISGRGDLEVSVLSALPWAALGAGMLINAWHSDRTQERYLHIGVPALLAAAGLVLGANVASPALALLCLCLGAFGLGSSQGAFWALPTSFLPPAVAASGITLINLLGSSGGLVAPPAIGWLRARAGSFGEAVYGLAALLVLGAALLVIIYRESAAQRGAAEPIEPLTRHS
ncbi:MAG TPA: MFS transporter [Polyangiales bacterium]|nr:MFS transporter [Polyangiales bacterium]